MHKISLMIPFVLAVGCSSATTGGDDPESAGVTSADLQAGGDWEISDEAHSMMQSFSLSYDDSGPDCSGGYTDGAKKLGEMIKSRFPSAIDHNEGYACRANTANPNKLSIHAMGRAVDIMMAQTADSGGRDAGKEVADYLLLNGDLLGVQFIIWDTTKCNLSQKACGHYSGPNPHTDHIHVEINEDAAGLNAPFYQGTSLREPGGGSSGGSSSGGSSSGGSSSGGSSSGGTSSGGTSSGGSSSGGGAGSCTSDADCPAVEWCSQHPVGSSGAHRCCTETDPAPECQD
jgi:hypothetical protein